MICLNVRWINFANAAEERNRSLRERLELQEKRWTNHIIEQKQQTDLKSTSKDKTNREVEERLRQFQNQLEDKNEEISSLRARESSNEEYSSRLARKLDRIMAENHNRTQKELSKLKNILEILSELKILCIV